MSSMNQALLALSDVKAYRGHAVVGGVVAVTDADFVKHLDNTYGEVVICNLNVKPGGALQQLNPQMFQAIRLEHQEALQHELLAQMVAANDVDIDYHH